MTTITETKQTQTQHSVNPLSDELESQNRKISELISILEKIHAATEAGAVYENLSGFRNPYDQVSASVQILSGVVGGSAWTNLEALRHFQQENGPERRKNLLDQLAHEEWFSNS